MFMWTIVDHCGPLWTIVDHCGRVMCLFSSFPQACMGGPWNKLHFKTNYDNMTNLPLNVVPRAF